jgi:Uma2 family endonuclease
MATVDQVTTADQLFEANLQHCELIAGELVMMSPAGFDHGRFALRIGAALDSFVTLRRLGVVVGAETGFQIARDPDTVRAPDVAFVRAERIPSGGVKGFFQGPPDLAVEVVSPGDRMSEVTAKAQDWLRAGCLLVWVVDPETQNVSIYRSGREVAVVTESDALTGEDVLPGFSTPVRDFFA